MGMRIQALLLAIVIGGLAACSTTVERVTDPDRLRNFAFLQPGMTSDVEVEARLGKPDAVYEDGRIATYRIDIIRGQYKPATRQSVPFRLVLIYRTDHVLDRWSLVHSGL